MNQIRTEEETLEYGAIHAQNSRICPRPMLSLILGARNDKYMGNFKWRLETILNYLAYNLQKLDRLSNTEVVITDWGSEIPLHTVLSLNSAARQIVRFVLVPPALAGELQIDSEFPIVLAQNAAVRRSHGEYIAQTDSDILFTTDFLEKLFDILEGHRPIAVPPDRSLLVSKRRRVPWRHLTRCPNIKELDWLVSHLGHLLTTCRMYPVEGLNSYTGTGIAIMHRSLWEDCRGYDEKLIHWGWMDIDLALRISHKYPWAFLQRFGLPEVFHLEHYLPWNENVTRRCNPMKSNSVFRPNNSGWGLEKYPLEESALSASKQELENSSSKNMEPVHPSFWLLSIVAQVLATAVWNHLKRFAINHLQQRMPKRLFSLLMASRKQAWMVWNYLRHNR